LQEGHYVAPGFAAVQLEKDQFVRLNSLISHVIG
jgi:hypothetical protein